MVARCTHLAWQHNFSFNLPHLIIHHFLQVGRTAPCNLQHECIQRYKNQWYCLSPPSGSLFLLSHQNTQRTIIINNCYSSCTFHKDRSIPIIKEQRSCSIEYLPIPIPTNNVQWLCSSEIGHNHLQSPDGRRTHSISTMGTNTFGTNIFFH